MNKQKVCGLKGCDKPIGPGAADVGYETEGVLKNVRVCAEHAWTLMNANPGTYRITPDLRLEAIPGRMFFT